MGSTTAERLGERLAAFLTNLPSDERALLAAILTDVGGEAEVSGYDAQAMWSTLSGAGPSTAEADVPMATRLTNIANMKHEMLKSVANNLRG